MKINTLRCRVTVLRAKNTKGFHSVQDPIHPVKKFEFPLVTGANSFVETQSDDAVTQEATQKPNGDNSHSHKAGASLVADRVYELMREETRMGRLRSGRN